MRDYKKKMDEVRIPKDRLDSLKLLCSSHSPESEELIQKALDLTFKDKNDGLREWIYRGVVLGWKWAKLEVNCIPCCRNIYNVYRARFFWNLDRLA